MIDTISNIASHNDVDPSKGYNPICNVGDIFYEFDPDRSNNIMVGEIIKFFPPSEDHSYECVEIYWTEYTPKEEVVLTVQDFDRSSSIRKRYHTDLNIAKIQYYNYHKNIETEAINAALKDISDHRHTLDKLEEEMEINMLKDKYAEHFI